MGLGQERTLDLSVTVQTCWDPERGPSSELLLSPLLPQGRGSAWVPSGKGSEKGRAQSRGGPGWPSKD